MKPWIRFITASWANICNWNLFLVRYKNIPKTLLRPLWLFIRKSLQYFYPRQSNFITYLIFEISPVYFRYIIIRKNLKFRLIIYKDCPENTQPLNINIKHLWYDTKLNLVVSLQIWRSGKYGVTPSLSLLPGPPWAGVVVPVRISSMRQRDLVWFVFFFNSISTFMSYLWKTIYRFGLVPLFNGISTLFRLFNAKAILLEEQ